MPEEVPTILIPYEGPCLDPHVQDIIIHLRPESNCIKVESTIIKAIKNYPAAGETLHIAYMANITGTCIIKDRIIEDHYALKLKFAEAGRDAFTTTMIRIFEDHFNISFTDANIIGSFQALKDLNMSYEELFHIWVPENDFFRIHGQTVKKYKNYFIVNYDMPALLHKNNRKTNIFTIILRSLLPCKYNHILMDSISQALSEEEILSERMPLSYILHYSKSPFEQILDGKEYIFDQNLKHVPHKLLSFFTYLLSKGCIDSDIIRSIENPIMMFQTEKGKVEKNLLIYTSDNTYQEAFEKFNCIVKSIMIA